MRLDDLQPPYLVIKPGLTEEDFYRLASEDSDWEYIDGRLVVHSPASFAHEDIQGFLLTLLRTFLGRKPTAVVLGSRYPMRLDPEWSPEPDIMVVRTERRELLGKQRLEGPADLVVEIASESDSHLLYREKLPRYRQAGIPEIWIVDPLRREVLVDRVLADGVLADGARATGREARSVRDGVLESIVVPGFRIEVEWLWRERLPPPHACMVEMDK